MFSSNTSQVAATATQAEAIDFDGTNDYLSRSTDLTGNANGKTFTLSAWVWWDGTNSDWVYYADGTGSTYFYLSLTSAGTMVVEGTSTTGTVVLSAAYSFSALANFKDTFYSVLISVDLANAANRSIYVNDQAASVTWTTYTNTNIAFAQPRHTVAGASGGANYRGRLSNIFLDYTYRDLSVTANRRLFVTADLKPAAGQAALNPILYLPMSDPTQPGLNSGTGGNFTLTGTVARSGRGPNQYNAPYSDLDGTADYLSRASDPTGLVDGNSFTLAFNINFDTVSAQQRIVYVAGGYFDIQLTSSNEFAIHGYTSALADVIYAYVSTAFVIGRNYQIVMSFDMSSTSKRHIYINGQAATVTYSAYNNANIDWTRNNFRIGATSVPDNYVNGRLGALWFNTSYIDLSVASNLAKFVTGTGIDAKPVDLGASGELPTGTSPLIYLPMYGNNAGKNYGTGGDFTVNSGPYTGARGPNEFWGNKADFNGTTGYLTKSSPLFADGKVFSAVFWIELDAVGIFQRVFSIQDTGNAMFAAQINGSNQLTLFGKKTTATAVLGTTTTSPTFAASTVYCVQICIDMANTANRQIYINGTAATTTWTTYVNDTINFSNSNPFCIGSIPTGNYVNGKISEFYLCNEYIDFSQEANRLKFRDAFGNPVNLTQQIEAAAIPNPAIYMRFPPTSFGTNSGTGGNFTVNGTITDGGQL